MKCCFVANSMTINAAYGLNYVEGMNKNDNVVDQISFIVLIDSNIQCPTTTP